MDNVFDYLTKELEKMGYKPCYTQINYKRVFTINFDLASRLEPSKLIFTLNSKDVVTVLAQENIGCPVLNILYFFPDVFNTQALEEAKYLANRINCVALLPGFFIDDLNKHVFFRHSIPWLNSSQNPEMLKSTLNLIVNTIDIFSDFFIQISLGTEAQDLLEEALHDYVTGISALAKA